MYKEIDGYRISLQSRNKLNLSSGELVYGEIDFDTFASILNFIDPSEETIFYDLGAGTGKPCIAISLLYKIKKAIGIELLPDLCQVAESVYERLKKIQSDINEVEFLCKNILDANFSDGNIIFIQATCYTEETLNMLEEKFKKLSLGSKIVIVTKSLKGNQFNLIFEDLVKFGWGNGTVRIYEKIA